MVVLRKSDLRKASLVVEWRGVVRQVVVDDNAVRADTCLVGG